MFAIRRSTLVSTALVLAALSVAPNTNAADVKLGTILPLSGPTGPNGQNVLNGVQLAVENINAQGGVLGRKITVDSKDDESTPAVGVSRANELVSDNVDVVIGGWSSTVALATQPVLARAGVLDITPVAKSDAVLAGSANPLAIRINSSNALDGAIVARYLVDNLHVKRIAFMTQNDSYGMGAQKVIEDEIQKLGKPVEVILTEKAPFKQTDFRASLANIKSANPDAVVVINSAVSAGMPALVQQYEEAGIKAPLVASVGSAVDTVYPIAGDSSIGMVSADIYFPDLAPFSGIAANQQFVKSYTAKYGKAPEKMAALGYAAVQVWAQAVKSTNTLDRKTVAEAIRGHQIDGTIFGSVKFAPDGQMGANFVMFKVVDGKTGKLAPVAVNN